MPIELNTKTPNTQTMGTMFNKSTEVANDNTKAKEIQSKALEVLAGLNVKITRSDDTSAGGIGERKTSGATNVPVLDNPDDAKAKEADLTKLMAYLQLDNQERQTQMAKDRIDMQKEGLDTEQKDRMKQIDESIKKMEKADREGRQAQPHIRLDRRGSRSRCRRCAHSRHRRPGGGLRDRRGGSCRDLARAERDRRDGQDD